MKEIMKQFWQYIQRHFPHVVLRYVHIVLAFWQQF